MAWPVTPISFTDSTPQYRVSRSVRLDGASGVFANKIHFEGNRRTFTQSLWFKRTSFDNAQWLTINPSATNGVGLYIGPDNRLCAFIFLNETANVWQGLLVTQQQFRDPTSWYHVNLAVDTTQQIPENRIKLAVNGSTVTSFLSSINTSNGRVVPTYPPLGTLTNFNTKFVSYDTNALAGGPGYRYIGGWPNSYFNGYISEINFVDGQALAPTAFGRYDENGIWVPRRYTGLYGPNGYYLPFNDPSSESTLGLDAANTNTSDPFLPFTVFHLQTLPNASTSTADNSTFLDSSNIGSTITRVGNPLQGTFNPYSYFGRQAATQGGSVSFDGSGDELNAGSNSNFAFGTGNYTVEFWIYPTVDINAANYSTGGPCFIFNDTTNGFGVWCNTTGLRVDSRGSGSPVLGTSTIPAANRWHHIAVARNGTTVSMWLNGTRIGTGGDTTNWTIPGPLKIGGISTNNFYFRGYMSGIRIVKDSALYDVGSTTITVPTAPPTNVTNTVFLANFTNAAVYDATGFFNLETIGTATVSNTQRLYGQDTLLLDGSTGTSTPSVSSTWYNNYLINFAANDFTVESWIWVRTFPTGSNPTTNGFIVGAHNNSSTDSWCFFLNANRTITFYGAGGNSVSSITQLPAESWVHVAAVRSGDFVTIYINGVADITTRITGNYFAINGSNALDIGRRGPVGAGALVDSFIGFISDLRITRAARYLSNFTVPQAPFPTTGNRSGWWPYSLQVNGTREMDSMLDVPTNWGTNDGGILSGTLRSNYCILSPVAKSANATVGNGGLDLSTPQGTTNWRTATSTIFLSSGKWYWEVECTAGSPTQTMFGIVRSDWPFMLSENVYPGIAGESWAYYGFTANNIYRNGAAIIPAYTAATISVGDVVGCALDLDNGNFFVSKNGVWQGAIPANPSIGRSPANNTQLAPGAWGPSIGVYNQNASNIGAVACNFGQRPFLYADNPVLSAGFKPICAGNVNTPAPVIRTPNKFFEAISYTGGTNTFNSDINSGNLVLALPLDSYNTYFDVSNEVSNRFVAPKALFTTAGVTYTSISGANFNGTSSYIELSSHPDFDLGIVGDWTIEWYQFWNSLAGFQTLWSNNYVTAPNLLIQSQNNLGRYQFYTNGGTAILNEGNAPTVGLWYHYALVKNGTTYTIFRDGSATGTVTYNAVTNAGSSTVRPYIGWGSSTFFLNSNIKDFKIYKGIAKYTTAFNPLTTTTVIVATTGTGFNKDFNLGFQPDLVWVKARNIGRSSHILVDSTRGNTSMLSANSTNVNSIGTNSVTINRNGFSVGGTSELISLLYPHTIYGVGLNEVSPGINALLNLDPLTTTAVVSTFTPIINQSISAINPYSPAYRHNVMLPASGTPEWYWNGWAYNGAAGTGVNTFSHQWQPLSGNWDKVLAGGEYTVALSAGTQTKWYATGKNIGQFGDGTTNNRLHFAPLSGDWSDIVLSVLGDNTYSTIFALSAGTQTKWYVAGNNGLLALPGSGKFGNGTTTDSSWFIPVPGNWTRLKSTRNNVFALSTDGKWYAWGYNGTGAFGNGTTTNTTSPVELSGNWADIIPGLAQSFALSAGTQTGWYAAGSGFTGTTSPNDISWYAPVSGGTWSAFKMSQNVFFALSASSTPKWYAAGNNNNGNAGLNNQNPITFYTPLSTTIGGDFYDLSVNWGHTFAFRATSVGATTSAKTPDLYLNTPGATYTAYGWKRNPIAGFDIVNFNKLNATNETFNHSLGKIPEMIIVKGINVATDWNVYHSGSVSTNPASIVTTLNLQAASAINITIWNNTRPTASQFSLGTAWSAGNFVAYLFAEIPGFSRFGSYRGTGISDGPVVWCGFKPRFVLTKRVDTVGDWLIWDSSRGPTNPIAPHFVANTNFQDQSIVNPVTYTQGYIDFLSTGFKLRLAGSDPNSVGGNFIFAAFADDVFGRIPGLPLAF